MRVVLEDYLPYDNSSGDLYPSRQTATRAFWLNPLLRTSTKLQYHPSTANLGWEHFWGHISLS